MSPCCHMRTSNNRVLALIQDVCLQGKQRRKKRRNQRRTAQDLEVTMLLRMNMEGCVGLCCCCTVACAHPFESYSGSLRTLLFAPTLNK